MERLFCVLATLLALVGPAFAQDQATTGPQSQGTQQEDTVQVGAGSKGDVTPGSSGPQSDNGQGIEPLPLTFEIRPPADPFYGPGMLPLAPPGQLRCEIIGDANAKSACEGKAAGVNGGEPHG